jgi:aspartate/tyrosine/aromatic aminotransferase
MLTELAVPETGLAGLAPMPEDPLLALITMCAADSRQEKIDVGVGVFRDGVGGTPILQVIKEAEAQLLATQVTKSYLGSAGDTRFTDLLRPIVLGPHADDERIAGLQTPGGCGALRLGFELIATANPSARVHVGTPTWPNHPPMIRASGLQVAEYPYYAAGHRLIRFDEMIASLHAAEPGDVALLHACCHNPTGADLSEHQWREIIHIVAARGLIPFIDMAYQGFGRGLDEDAFGVRLALEACDEVLVAQSCDKNFGVYRDRVGALFVKCRSRQATATAMAHVFNCARQMWSMPPDHGAAAVRLVLDDARLSERWHQELGAMRERINSVRKRIGGADPRLAYIQDQYGMFSMLPLTRDEVVQLRSAQAIYMADSGRFNVVGMSDSELERFIAAIVAALPR